MEGRVAVRAFKENGGRGVILTSAFDRFFSSLSILFLSLRLQEGKRLLRSRRRGL